MNRENVQYMKQIMMSAENLDMERFIRGKNNCNSIEELHSCGNTACFAGYMALSEKFQKEGGQITPGGEPILVKYFDNDQQAFCGAMAVAKWLEISDQLADGIVFNEKCFFERFLDIQFHEVEPKHLVLLMDWILNGELK